MIVRDARGSQRQPRESWGAEGTPRVKPLARAPRIARAHAGKILIASSDCGKLLPVKRFAAVYRDAVIRVYDEAGSVIETQEHTGEFKEW